jgi:RNA polymerase sigma-70 factor (ECF subfamily)
MQSLYQEQLGPIYRYIYSKVGNREEAEDLTSQVFLKAVRSLDRERSYASMRQWLFQVARTTVADHWRAWYGLPSSSLETLLLAGWEGPAEVESPWVGSEPAERVAHILQALPERQREVLTYRFLLALSVRDTAKKMGLTEQNVKVLQFRALKRAAALEDS